MSLTATESIDVERGFIQITFWELYLLFVDWIEFRVNLLQTGARRDSRHE